MKNKLKHKQNDAIHFETRSDQKYLTGDTNVSHEEHTDIMSTPPKRSVRFTESASEEPPQKRSRIMENHGSKERAPGPSVLRPSSHKVPKSNHGRFNEDELDDIDDWNEEEDGDFEARSSGARLPSQSELIEAKRKRREQRSAVFDDNDHPDEAETSLAKEGIKIEPFNMREEETDGTGYFDGDTYVFRKNVPAEDGEADAWADTLMQDGSGNGEDQPKISIARNRATRKETESSSTQEDLDDLTKEQLYKRIVPLMGDSMESIMEAIRRFGKLAKTKTNPKNRRNQSKTKQQETKDNNNNTNVAKSHLDELTGAASALLLKGEVDIYDRTRQDILRMFPSLVEQIQGKSENVEKKATTTTSKPKWEYQGNEDSKLHGPYTTEQMIAWVRSGYFVGAQRVKIRTVSVQETANEEKVQPQLSTEDDLMADLMDDEDEEQEESRPAKKAKDEQSVIIVKGPWMWSNEIHYEKYL